MGDVLNEAYGVVQCKECPWFKTCATPMRFSAEDLRKQMAASAPGSVPPTGNAGMENFLAGMASAAQNSLLEACPIFIERLRSSPKLAKKLKELMQNWTSEG